MFVCSDIINQMESLSLMHSMKFGTVIENKLAFSFAPVFDKLDDSQ